MWILYNMLANVFVFRYSSTCWYPFCLPWWYRVSKSGIAGQFGTIIVLGAHYVFCIQKWSYVKSVNSLAYRLGGLFEGCHGVSTCRWSPLPCVASKTLSASHVGWGKVAPILPMCLCKFGNVTLWPFASVLYDVNVCTCTYTLGLSLSGSCVSLSLVPLLALYYATLSLRPQTKINFVYSTI